MIEAPLADEERREIQVCEDVFEPLPVGRRVLRSELFPEPRIRRTLRVRLDSAARDRNRARRNRGARGATRQRAVGHLARDGVALVRSLHCSSNQGYRGPPVFAGRFVRSYERASIDRFSLARSSMTSIATPFSFFVGRLVR